MCIYTYVALVVSYIWLHLKINYCYILCIIHEQILGSALRKNLNEDERSALLYQLALMKNASLDLVNTVINNIPSSDDSIVLVLGALARNTNLTVQKVAVDELLKRLNTMLASGNTESVTTLIYALGNSGSKMAISPLLVTLQYDNIDIQISTIRSLESHLDQPVVQQAIIALLPLTEEHKILEEILKILIDAFENMILTTPNEQLIDAIMKSIIQFENPNLYELLEKYLQKLKINDVDIYLDLLKQQENYGDLRHDQVNSLHKNDTRVKRGSQWDENNPDYDVVTSYSQRKDDVLNYPYHKAYIWGKTFGVDKLNMKVGAGAFAGVNINLTNANLKIYTKAVAKVNVFGREINVVDMELSGSSSGKELVYNLYLKQGKSIEKNDKKTVELQLVPIRETANIARTREIFDRSWPIFLYVATLHVNIKGTLTSKMQVDTSVSVSLYPQPNATISGDAQLSLELRITAGTYASLVVNQLYTTT